MIKVNIIAVGKLKEKYFISAAEEYIKRLKRYCDISVFELPQKSIAENASALEIKKQTEAEGKAILQKIPKNSIVISLAVEGRELSSEELADITEKYKNEGKNICFIIGGSYGLCEEVKNASDLKISFSKMTFPHKLFRVMLLEQVYRAFKINEGSAYHK